MVNVNKIKVSNTVIAFASLLLLFGCKPRQSELSDDYSEFRDQSPEVQARYHLMQRDYKEGETVFLHTDLFRVTLGEEKKELPPGFPTWNQMFQPYANNLSEDQRFALVFAYYNFFEEKKLAAPWNEWADEKAKVRKHFPLIEPPTQDRIGKLNHYLLRAKVFKEYTNAADSNLEPELVGKVEWLMDTEYAPEAVRMALFLATTPMFSPNNEKVADNFFEPFHVDYDLTYYKTLYLGLPYAFSPIYLEPCNNPGRPYRPEPKAQARSFNRFVPGSSRQVETVFDKVKKEYQTFPFGSLMMAADNEHGAEFLTGVDLGEYLWELEEEKQKEAATEKEGQPATDQPQDDGLTGQERVDQSKAVIGAMAGENSRFNASLRKVVITRLLINTHENIAETNVWNGKRRPIVIGYPSTPETKDVIHKVNKAYHGNALFLGHKFRITEFEVAPYEIKNLALTRKFLPNLAQRGCGNGTIADRLLEESGYQRIKLPESGKQPKPLQPQPQKQSPFFPTNTGPSDAPTDSKQEGGQ